MKGFYKLFQTSLPNQAKSSQIKPNQTKSNQIKPNQTKSSQIKPNQTKSNQIKPNQTIPYSPRYDIKFHAPYSNQPLSNTLNSVSRFSTLLFSKTRIYTLSNRETSSTIPRYKSPMPVMGGKIRYMKTKHHVKYKPLPTR